MDGLTLHQLRKAKGWRRQRKRVGRGQGSGKGSHTTGRGAKGQKGRGRVRVYFEGGQTPLGKKVPQQRGFKKRRDEADAALKISSLNVFEEGTTVDLKKLKEQKLVGSRVRRVKIIRGGRLDKKLNLVGFVFSEGARREVEVNG